MKYNELSQAEIEKRFSEINTMEPEELTAEEATSLAEAEAMDDGTAVEYKEYLKSLEDYSGKLVIRIPRSLHKELKDEAKIEGVSLNQYMLYKLSK